MKEITARAAKRLELRIVLVANQRLSIRNFMDDLRSTGVEMGGPAPYGARKQKAFDGALDRTLTRVLRGR